MTSYSQRWEQEGKAWGKILDRIESAAKQVVKRSLEVRINREKSDVPSLGLRWYSDGIGRSVKMYITDSKKGYELMMRGVAWKDVKSTRKWKEEGFGVVMEVPDNPKELDRDEVRRNFAHFYKEVSNWTEEELDKEGKLPKKR